MKYFLVVVCALFLSGCCIGIGPGRGPGPMPRAAMESPVDNQSISVVVASEKVV